MTKSSIFCEQCGGNIILDNSHEIGTGESCFVQFVVKQDKAVQKVTQNITKHVYGFEGKDVEGLLQEGYRLINLRDYHTANFKFKRAIDIEPNCWSAHLGYAMTNGDGTGYLSMIPEYRRAYNLASTEQQEIDTFVSMTAYLPDLHLRAAFIRAYSIATQYERTNIFNLVSGVIGCDESEIATLAVDICPDDWRSHFAMAKFRQIRARWCRLEGGFFTGKHLPSHAIEVLNIFVHAYQLAKNEGEDPPKVIRSYIDNMAKDQSYSVFAYELIKQIQGIE